MSVEDFPEGSLSNRPEAAVIPLRHDGLWGRVDVVGSREGGLIDCFVPAELIDFEEVPVKEEWAQSLAREMRQKSCTDGGTGQMAPIILGYIEGEPTFKIVDGFHRDAALRINNEDVRYATVVRTTWDKLYDDRIFLAKDHVHVRFSRVVQWIREAWEFSGLADMLTVEQAVLMYRFETDGSKLGLKAEDATEAKSWIQRKEEQWQMAAMTIHSHLKIAENVDPQLVHSTREKKDSRVLDAPTQVIIKIFSDMLPNDFPMQNLVMDVAKQQNLKGPQVKALCATVKECGDIAEAQTAVAGIDWDNWQPEYGSTTKKALRRASDPRFKGSTVLNRVIQDTANVRERVQQSLQVREPVDEAMRQRLQETRDSAEAVIQELAGLATDLTLLIGDKRLLTGTKQVTLPESRARQPNPFQTVVRAFLDGRIDRLPSIATPEQIKAAESLLEWDSFIRDRTPQSFALEDKIEKARGLLAKRD